MSTLMSKAQLQSALVLRATDERDIPAIYQMIMELAEFEKLAHEVKCNESILKNSLFPCPQKVASGEAIRSARAVLLELPQAVYAEYWKAHCEGEGPFPSQLPSAVDPDRVVVGFCLYFFNFSTFWGQHNVYIEDLCIRSAFRGLGFGSILLNSMFRHALEQHQVTRVEWWVLKWNQGAIQLYDRVGAKPMSEWSTYRITGEALEKYRDMPGLLKVQSKM
jgi:RimJ/RimL family protein N-acetyltransferase